MSPQEALFVNGRAGRSPGGIGDVVGDVVARGVVVGRGRVEAVVHPHGPHRGMGAHVRSVPPRLRPYPDVQHHEHKREEGEEEGQYPLVDDWVRLVHEEVGHRAVVAVNILDRGLKGPQAVDVESG